MSAIAGLAIGFLAGVLLCLSLTSSLHDDYVERGTFYNDGVLYQLRAVPILEAE